MERVRRIRSTHQPDDPDQPSGREEEQLGEHGAVHGETVVHAAVGAPCCGHRPECRPDRGEGHRNGRQPEESVRRRHPIHGNAAIRVASELGVLRRPADGRKLDGTLAGTYPEGDLAVVHVTGADLRPATFGDSSKLDVGDIVLALGSPLGLQSSVTQGIISALGRSVPESASVTLPDVIQTSAEINPGNSGGALVDLAGDVVGIPTLAALDPQLGDTAAAGIGFAIPSNVVVDIAGQLIASGHVTTAPAPSTIPTTAS